MADGASESKNTIVSMSVYPRGDPYRQARQLLMLGMIQKRWLLIHGVGCEEAAWRLAESLDALIHRGLRTGTSRIFDFRPCGTVIFGLHHITQFAKYRAWDLEKKQLSTAYIKAEENPYKQVREILFSGIASKACIILHGPFDYVHGLLRPLHDTIMRGSYNGVRIVEPRPLGIYVLTKFSLFKYVDYTRIFTYKA